MIFNKRIIRTVALVFLFFLAVFVSIPSANILLEQELVGTEPLANSPTHIPAENMPSGTLPEVIPNSANFEKLDKSSNQEKRVRDKPESSNQEKTVRDKPESSNQEKTVRDKPILESGQSDQKAIEKVKEV
jgi:hypothetical protein